MSEVIAVKPPRLLAGTIIKHRMLAAGILSLFAILHGCANYSSIATNQAYLHPVFRTQLSGASESRPAIQVDILDATEHIFFTAELYLAVQSSRFPNDTSVLIPLNVGDFAGCTKRFVQLPFEVSPGDVLLFNVLDDDTLTQAEEQQVIRASQEAGYCIVAGGSVFQPNLAQIVSPTVRSMADILGSAIVQEARIHEFENYGSGEFIVPDKLPGQPNEANKLTLMKDAKYAPVQVKIYGPRSPLIFQPGSSSSEGRRDLNRQDVVF